jgi:hypothetical protein
MVNDLRVCARYARARTDTPTVRDLGKWVTAIYWGSSGRRFKSCQPDNVKPALTSIGAGFYLPR